MKDAVLYFHQGFSDIINCLPLVTFFKKQYDILHVVIRQECLEMLSFYVRHLDNICIIPIPHNTAIGNFINIYNYGDILFFGDFDIFRNDQYNGIYNRRPKIATMSFVELFYTPYGIDYIHRIESFELYRDYDMENEKYTNVVKDMKEYILYHDNNIVEILPKKQDCNIIQLDHVSNMFFDCIKILENSKEIHMIDSVWACLTYLIDCKYKLFHDKKIYIYCKRSFGEMFTSPIKLDHWILL